MKKITLTFILFLAVAFTGSLNAQSNKWASVAYAYSKGPVSPEFQYKYTISISSNGSGILTYTKGSATINYDFKVGKNGRKKLNTALRNSQVLTVSPDEMKSDENLFGGATQTMVITMLQASNVDQKPTTIEVPARVKSEYLEGVSNVYNLMENLVPQSVWDKATE